MPARRRTSTEVLTGQGSFSEDLDRLRESNAKVHVIRKQNAGVWEVWVTLYPLPCSLIIDPGRSLPLWTWLVYMGEIEGF